MKTEQWLDLLARGAGPAPRRIVETRLGAALGLGTLASAGAALATLGLNPDLAGLGAALAVKLTYVAGLLLGAVWLADRAARPAAPLRGASASVLAVALAMAALAIVTLWRAPGAARMDLLLGSSWSSCPWRVAALSLPALAVALWAMRGLAPTRPRVAGFAAGLIAGGLGALGYALFCTEVSPVFVFVWYTLGILGPATLGAVLGPRVLRW
ncbi:MAG: DUF1109 domain-containing protein [Burkholderiales bacterium]|nr:DUF1109 domain-containing protein [Burkholderiales bacterium]